MPRVIDLFCGVGGLTHGFLQHGGFEVVAGVDADASCRFAYEHNNQGAQFLYRDVADEDLGAELNGLFGDEPTRILIGCAPCQTFSTYSQPAQTAENDPRWTLLARFGELVSETHPHVVSMENVPKLRSHPVFAQFVATLEALGMHVWHDVVESADFGISQTRRRLVLLASTLGPIEPLAATHADQPVTVRQVIGDLPPIEAGAADPEDRYHRASGLSELNLQRIIASAQGGTWRDWDEDLRADCHRRDTGRSFPGVYGRMTYDAVGPTITTQFHGFGNGRFGHPEQNRAISLREGALLQTFPAEYEFVPLEEQVSFAAVAKHIGNAVPVRLGEVIAEHIHTHLIAHGLAEPLNG
jgi:DNA (cytosine-5)-methyltransferase 1